jgi:hypothetical protein
MAMMIQVVVFWVVTLCSDGIGYPEGAGSKVSRDVGILPYNYTVSEPRRSRLIPVVPNGVCGNIISADSCDNIFSYQFYLE